MIENYSLISQSVASTVAAVVNEYASADDKRKREIIKKYKEEAKKSEYLSDLQKKLLDDPNILAMRDDYALEGKALGTIIGGIIGGALGGVAGAGVGATIGGAVGEAIGGNIDR